MSPALKARWPLLCFYKIEDLSAMVERLLWEENARVEEKLRAANLTWSDVARQRELAQRAKPVDIGEPESVARVELEQKATARIRAASD